MSKSLRLSEKWFRRGLWLVAFLFAWFLTGLGSTIVGDLPQVEQTRSLEDFMDPQRTPVLKESIKTAEKAAEEAQAALEQAQLKLQTARADNRAARETFDNWLATRSVTQRAEQDEEVLQRTRELDGLRKIERDALAAVEKQQQVALDARQAQQRAQAELSSLEDAARDTYMEEQRAQELRVFGYRLALTLPLLVVPAGCSRSTARDRPGRLSGASSSSRCSRSSSSWCPTCRATAAMCATSWASCSR